jgi:hypothetical protein
LAINLLGEEALIQANTTATRNTTTEPLEKQEQTPTPPVLDMDDVGTSVVQAMPPSVVQATASIQIPRKQSSPNTTARGLASKQKKRTA